MERLRFENPVFNDGRNITVRRGIRWNDVTSTELCDKDGQFLDGLRRVNIKTSVMRFADLNDSDLIDEHDERCRTVDGLFAVMCEVYPGFDWREIVTLVTFEL